MPSSADKTANAWDNLPGFDPVAEKYVQLDSRHVRSLHGERRTLAGTLADLTRQVGHSQRSCDLRSSRYAFKP